MTKKLLLFIDAPNWKAAKRNKFSSFIWTMDSNDIFFLFFLVFDDVEFVQKMTGISAKKTNKIPTHKSTHWYFVMAISVSVYFSWKFINVCFPRFRQQFLNGVALSDIGATSEHAFIIPKIHENGFFGGEMVHNSIWFSSI